MFVSNRFRSVAVLIFVLGLFFVPIPAGSLWLREALDSGHVVVFSLISFVLYYQLSITKPFLNKTIIYFIVFVIAMSFGAIVEMLQGVTQRETSLEDIYRNMIGILAGLCFVTGFDLKNKSYRRAIALCLLVGSCLIIMGLYPLIQMSGHYIDRAKAFPVITAFHEQWSSSFILFNNAEILKDSTIKGSKNSRLYLIRFNQGRYPGVSVIEPEPDWSKYDDLRFTIFSRYEKSIELVLRVHDKKHNQEHADRFNKKLYLRQGINEIEISLKDIKHGPINRELDLSNVAGIILFSNDVEDELELALGNIYLK